LPPQAHNLTVVRLRRMSYSAALEVQLRAVDRVRFGRQGDGRPVEYLLLVEHDPPVITLGRGSDRENVLASADRLAEMGIELHESSRGGDVTYHGPGQLVAYPVLDLNLHGRDVHRYLRDIEQTVLRLLARYEIEGRRDREYTGVWVGHEKVCAIGVAITRWVTYHGLALNVAATLDNFELIVPCGIPDRSVTSLETLLGRQVTIEEVAAKLVEEFVRTFEFTGAVEGQASDI